ncbi:YceD family protein [Salipaludibacillus sp. CUR1]|uniref:YceD family protein n=1 Tax=Salipaludibacillus sp. CUR1 TaxID=2820003 RepID=UPI001E2C1FC0|nr:YceD family protein [Salipaludibacillus sp. CUR1]MCE7794718.1 YceD family protein [Salipaludibacillus sp. CUR1]
MKWSVQQLLAFKQKGLQIDESVDASKVKEIDREIRDITPVRVKGETFIANDSVTFQLDISGSMTLPCARTLNDVEYPFSMQATEIFLLDEWATFEEDEDVHELKDNTVDLMPYVQERILLEKPMRVFSDKKEGPAPESGNGWELTTKDEPQKEKVDPRLKELEKFFDKNS